MDACSQSRKGKVLMNDRDFIAQLKGYSLTTAEILYHMPDHPALLQSYVWQDYDLAPRFPKLIQFLTFWNGNLDGKVSRVRVCSKRLIDPAEFRFLDGRFVLQ
jgi:uncharacterized protein Usg